MSMPLNATKIARRMPVAFGDGRSRSIIRKTSATPITVQPSSAYSAARMPHALPTNAAGRKYPIGARNTVTTPSSR